MPHSAPRLSAGAEDFRPIEADLEGFSPGRVAAVGVRGRAVIYIVKVNVHERMTRATRPHRNICVYVREIQER